MTWILHMSDPHIGYPGTLESFRRLVRGFTNSPHIEPGETVVILTGDIVHRARGMEDFELVARELQPLRSAGFRRLLAVPGNHDYGRGTRTDKRFVPLFKQVFFGGERSYPKLDIVDDIAFIGLDTMAEELNWYDQLWAEGEIGQDQLSRLAALLEDGEVRECRRRVIYLHHHPFDWQPFHQLKDSLALGEALKVAMGERVSIDAILYGHHHRGRSSNGHWGIRRCYDAGTSTLKPRHRVQRMLPWFKEIHNSTRIFDLEGEPSEDRLVHLREESVPEEDEAEP
jgi:3',5'-cyclic AMP phosphodiesterase CpdA